VERAIRTNLYAAITSDAAVIIKIKTLLIATDRPDGTEFPAFPANLAEVVITYGPLQEVPADKAVHHSGTKNRGNHSGKLKIRSEEHTSELQSLS